jgi:hypothetical protein
LFVSGTGRRTGFGVAMATLTMLLQAIPGPVAQMRSISLAHRNEMYTMLQTPSIGGVRRFAGDRNGHGVCMKKTVLRGFRAQSGISTSDSLLVGASN